MNIGVIGCGYVGLSNAILLANSEEVTLWDIDANKLNDILSKKLPFDDNELKHALDNVIDHLSSANSVEDLVINNQIIIIAMPTNYNDDVEELNTCDIEETVRRINECAALEKRIVIIRSTVPIGFTNKLQSKYKNLDICFMPEFLREGCCYHDTLFPERIVIGGEKENINRIYQLYSHSIKIAGGNAEVERFLMEVNEAESVKLFSNTYLAMRVAFFNELDTFSEKNNMSSNSILRAVCADSRVGNIYNSPSFGYGGYCLPKDTKQLSNQLKFPLIGAINESNEYRKEYITQKLVSIGGPVGVYRIQSKKGANNTRNSVAYDLIKKLSERGIDVIYYEPLIKANIDIRNVIRAESVSDLASQSNIIIANWIDSEIIPYLDKVYSRDSNSTLM